MTAAQSGKSTIVAKFLQLLQIQLHDTCMDDALVCVWQLSPFEHCQLSVEAKLRFVLLSFRLKP